MPTVEQNKQQWNQDYEWTRQGEEWSAVWGGSEAQWFGAILPRIHAFIPTSRILEIAPGFGRWTIYLKKYCEYLTVMFEKVQNSSLFQLEVPLAEDPAVLIFRRMETGSQ